MNNETNAERNQLAEILLTSFVESADTIDRYADTADKVTELFIQRSELPVSEESLIVKILRFYVHGFLQGADFTAALKDELSARTSNS